MRVYHALDNLPHASTPEFEGTVDEHECYANIADDEAIQLPDVHFSLPTRLSIVEKLGLQHTMIASSFIDSSSTRIDSSSIRIESIISRIGPIPFRIDSSSIRIESVVREPDPIPAQIAPNFDKTMTERRRQAKSSLVFTMRKRRRR